MRHQHVRPGMLVSLRGDARERYENQDLDGKYFVPVMRVGDMYVTNGRREPWIKLEGFNAQLRAKDLMCGACGASRTPGCPECGWAR